MATQIAMEKLMPKPKVQVTISMQGGGGLAGLGDRPIIRRFAGGYTDKDAGVTPDTFSMSDWDTYGGWRPATDILGGGKTPEELADIFDNSDAPPEVSSDTTTFRNIVNFLGLDPPPGPSSYRSLPPSQNELRRANREEQRGGFGFTETGIAGLKDKKGSFSPIVEGGREKAWRDEEQKARINRSDAENLAIDRVKNYMDEVRAMANQPPVSYSQAAIAATNPSAAHQFLVEVHTNKFYGDAATSIEVPEELISAQQERRKGGGGLSSVKKSININGQPHNLAWINSDEASALKAMGGSGKKVDGIPAYYYGSFGSSPEADIIDYDEAGTVMSDAPSYLKDEEGKIVLRSRIGSLGKVRVRDIDKRSGMSADSPEMRVTGELPVEWKSLYPEWEGKSFNKALIDTVDTDGPRQGGDNPWNPYSIKDKYNTPELRGILQRAINRGQLQGIGIEFANAWESEGLKTFGKAMRGPYEAWTSGDALDRDVYDPGILVGTADLTDDIEKRKQGEAANEFVSRLDMAEEGETVGDIVSQYREVHGENPPVELFGYSSTSSAPASEVYNSLNDARKSGFFKGAALMAGLGPGTLAQIVSTRFITNPETGKSSITDAYKNLTSIGFKKLEDFLPKSITEDGEESKLRSAIKTGVNVLDVIKDPLGSAVGYALKKGEEMYSPASVADNYRKDALDFSPLPKATDEDGINVDDWLKATDEFYKHTGSSPKFVPFNTLKSLGINIGKPDIRPRIRTSEDKKEPPILSKGTASLSHLDVDTEENGSKANFIASLPIATEEEEEIRDLNGAMVTHLTAPKSPSKDPFMHAFLDTIYYPKNIYQA